MMAASFDQGGSRMFHNYLMTALSNLARNWLYAAISISGLAVSFAGAILVAQFVRNEFSYDKWIPGYEQVYKVHHSIQQPGAPKTTSDYTQFTIKKQILEADPKSVLFTARLMQSFPTIFQNPDPGDGGFVDQTFSWADPEIFAILPLPVVEGELTTALQQPGTVAMTQSAARKYFGRESVMGETLTLGGPNNSRIPLRVTAILKDLPSNTNLVTEIFASSMTAEGPLANIDKQPPAQLRTGIGTYTFVKIATAATPEDLQRALDVGGKPESDAFGQGGIEATFWAVPMEELHTTSPGMSGPVTKPVGSKTTTFLIAAVGALIVLVAAINFVTLMTARASRRALEVGVRKANGASRTDLVIQFMGEALIYAILSMLAAVILANLLVEPFGAFVQRGIELDFLGDPGLAGWLIAATFVIGVLGGLYPAFVLSSFRPSSVLQGGKVRQSGSPIARQALVVAQFAILIGLVVATITIYRQTQFALSQGLGKESEMVVQVQTNCQNAFLAEVRKLPGVERAACSSLNALSSPAAKNITPIVVPDGRQLTFSIAPVDFEFFETFDIKPLAGRVFDRARGNDGPLPVQALAQGSSAGQQPGSAAPSPQGGAPAGPPSPPPQVGPRPVVLNESAAVQLGYARPEDAVGKTMTWQQPGAGQAPLPSEIIGIVADIPVSVGVKADSTFYFVAPRMVNMLTVKTTGENLEGTVADIRRIWKDTGNVRPIQLTFYADTRRVQYLDVIIQSTLIAICAGAAVAIACLGLFALSAFAAEQRTKEIGIRKALGATTSNVLGLLMWQFTVPVLWAIAIALPAGWYVMTLWLQGYAYHVDLAPWTFALAALAALAIAWLTVSFQTFIVANAKPVKALRYE